MYREFLFAIAVVLVLSLMSTGATAQSDPVVTFIVAADSVNAAAGQDALDAWLGGQPDLAGAAAAQLLDVAARVAAAGNAEGEAENLALVEALATAHERFDPDSALPGLLAEYRAWDDADRRARVAARTREDEAWASVGADPDAALADLQAADSVYAHIVDSPSRARAWGRMGAAHWYRGDVEGVQAAYAEALRRRREVQNRMLEAATLNGLGSVHFQLLGDLDGAARWYAEAIELREAIGDRSGLGTSLTYAANVEVERGNLITARGLYERARPMLASPVAVVENLAGTAGLYQTLGRTGDAIQRYEEAIALCGESADCPYGAGLFVELAELQRISGQVREALVSLRRAGELSGDEADPALGSRILMIRSLCSADLGDEDAAREAMVGALRLARESGDPALQCDTSVLLSGLYRKLGAIDRARSTASEALDLAREIGDERLERAALSGRAAAALAAGDAASALADFHVAIEIDERLGDRFRLARDLTDRGGAFSQAGEFERARADLRRASSLFVEAGQGSERWVAELNLADSFEETEPDSAAWYYDRALASLERGSDAVGGAALNTGYLFADRGRAYEEIARYYASRHRAEPSAGWDARAFATAERSRARGLLELLETSFMRDAGPETLALVDSLNQIDATTDEGRHRRERLRERLDEQRARSRPEGIGRETAGLDQVRAALGPDALLLQYAVGDSTTLLWIVDHDAVELVELPARQALRRRVTAFRDAVAQPGRADEIVLREGHALYLTLLGPAAGRIARHQHLVLVPDDVLFELPFEALLVDEATAGAAWSEQPFFGRDHAPVLVPSSTVYLALRERGAPDFDRALVAVGDVDYSTVDAALEPLPYTRDEVVAIGAALDADQRTLLLGATATEPGFREAIDAGAPRVVHLATHGLIDPAEPSLSSVVLGAAGDDDGYLRSLEILSLDLEQPMIVLSACESALGRLQRGEGVVGLTRSFLAAGARGVVASLWPVPDASTAALMAGFYEELWERRSAAESLRRARNRLLADEQWSHPYFWSAFVLVGTETMPW